jgi:phosphoglycerate kinase
MDLPRLEDLPEPAGRRVLVRVDFNVPLAGEPGAIRVADDFRIRAALPTLRWLVEAGAEVTACSHLGRPKGREDERYRMEPVRRRLAEMLDGVSVLENLRFDPGEEANDPAFVDRLVSGQDLYVNDAFGSSHRAHASIVGPPGRLPSAAGRLLEREVTALGRLLEHPEQPFVAVVGGAKVSDKLGVLRSLLERVDTLVVGGGMAFTFLRAAGHRVGDSLVEEGMVPVCEELLHSQAHIVLPVDVVALESSAPFGRDAPAEGEVRVVGVDLAEGWRGLDIGPESRAAFAAVLASARTVLWNGPMGVFEDRRFADGTRAVAEAAAASPAYTVVGGGDSVAALEEMGLADRIDHVSTGGGASLEFIEKGDLPGLEALRRSVGRR